MVEEQTNNWRLSRQINISVLVQLVLLAGLIVGSWVNLQSQLSLLRHDVSQLIVSQKNLQRKFEALSAKSIEYRYRLQAVEQKLTKAEK